MSATPFYRVYMSGNGTRDISSYVSSLKYEDSMEEDSSVEIYVHKEKVMELLDDDRISEGTRIYFQFGFYGGQVSKVHTAIMKDIEVNYSQNGVTLLIRALDEGSSIKKGSSPKIWKEKTTSEIAYEIAKTYHLRTEIERTSTKWPDVPQGNRSDLELLRHLAAQEEDGNFTCYIRNNTLYLKRRNMKKKSIKTFTWGAGDPGEVISFAPKWRESTKKPEAGTTIVNSKAVNNQTARDNTILGNFYSAITGNAMSEEQVIKNSNNAPYGKWPQAPTKEGIWEGRPQLPPRGQGKYVLSPGPYTPIRAKAAENLGNSAKKAAELKILTANLRVLLYPLAEPNNVLTMAGCANRHNGNWFIEKVVHQIDASKADTTFYLLRNGKKSGGGEKAKDKNTSVGPKKEESLYRVRTAISGDVMPYIDKLAEGFDGGRFKTSNKKNSGSTSGSW